MKSFLILISVIFFNISFAQNFHLKYWFVGLGSNAVWNSEDNGCNNGLEIEISDLLLTFSECENSGEYKIDTFYNDTIWLKVRNYQSVLFRKSSIDSILTAIDSLKSKYVYKTNLSVMSGGISNFYIENAEWCSHLEMKNTCDSTFSIIKDIINSYLEKQFKIYTFNIENSNNKLASRFIDNCPRYSEGSYRETLEKDYEILKKSK